MNYIKSILIDYLRRESNRLELIEYFNSLNINVKKDILDYKEKLIKNLQLSDEYMIELLIINKILNIPIVIYNDYENIIAIYDEDVKYQQKYNIGNDKIIEKYKEKKDNINIKFEFAMKNLISNFSVIFYK